MTRNNHYAQFTNSALLALPAGWHYRSLSNATGHLWCSTAALSDTQLIRLSLATAAAWRANDLTRITPDELALLLWIRSSRNRQPEHYSGQNTRSYTGEFARVWNERCQQLRWQRYLCAIYLANKLVTLAQPERKRPEVSIAVSPDLKRRLWSGARLPARPTRLAERRALRQRAAGFTWKFLKFPEGEGQTARLRDITQDWRGEILLEYGSKNALPTRTLPVVNWTTLLEEVNDARSDHPSALRPQSAAPRQQAWHPFVFARLSADSGAPGQQAITGQALSPASPASESPALRQASPPPDDSDSGGNKGASPRQPRLRRHSAPSEAHSVHISRPPADPRGNGVNQPANHQSQTGTDLRALRIYDALIQQTPEADYAELETLGQQIRATRTTLGLPRRQLATLLHLDLEVLAGLENGCGNLETAHFVLEQVTGIVKRQQRQQATTMQ